MANFLQKTYGFFLKEWLLSGAFVGLILTSLLGKRLPHYTYQDAEVLFVLWVYLLLIKGLERKGFFKSLATRLVVATRQG